MFIFLYASRAQAVRNIKFANHQSAVRLNAREKACRLPMKLRPSWNYLNIECVHCAISPRKGFHDVINCCWMIFQSSLMNTSSYLCALRPQCSLQNVLQSAFGVGLSYVQRIKVKAQCRVWRIFFQSRPHAHIELPESLQLPKLE